MAVSIFERSNDVWLSERSNEISKQIFITKQILLYKIVLPLFSTRSNEAPYSQSPIIPYPFWLNSVFVFAWFWRNRFLKGQTTSDEIFKKSFITKQILMPNFAVPLFFLNISTLFVRTPLNTFHFGWLDEHEYSYHYFANSCQVVDDKTSR